MRCFICARGAAVTGLQRLRPGRVPLSVRNPQNGSTVDKRSKRTVKSSSPDNPDLRVLERQCRVCERYTRWQLPPSKAAASAISQPEGAGSTEHVGKTYGCRKSRIPTKEMQEDGDTGQPSRKTSQAAEQGPGPGEPDATQVHLSRRAGQLSFDIMVVGWRRRTPPKSRDQK